MLPVVNQYGQHPFFLLERAMCPWFGTKAFGVHINGYVADAEDGAVTHMFIGRRALTKSTFPGMLDHIVAGGQPHGISLMDNVVKECSEEASIPAHIARQVKAVGAVGYNHLDDSAQRLKRDVLFCFDLQLSKSFQPKPADGEVEHFMVKEVEWVLEKILTEDKGNEFKPNCILVILDFFIR
jgi:isopentenyldiphosphate isomerase